MPIRELETGLVVENVGYKATLVATDVGWLFTANVESTGDTKSDGSKNYVIEITGGARKETLALIADLLLNTAANLQRLATEIRYKAG